MELAKPGDKFVIEIVGIDPDGIPDGIVVEYFRNGHRIEEHPAFVRVGGWTALRTGAFLLISQWWRRAKALDEL